MLRSKFVLTFPQKKVSSYKILHFLKHGRFQSSSSGHSSQRGIEKVAYGIVASTGLCITGAVVYGRYDPNFKKVLEENIPYIHQLYKLFPSEEDKATKPVAVKEKVLSKDTSISHSVPKKPDQEKESVVKSVEVEKASAAKNIDLKSRNTQIRDPQNISGTIVSNESGLMAEPFLAAGKIVDSYENSIREATIKLNKVSEDAVRAFKSAQNLIVSHTNKLYEALDLPEANNDSSIWNEVKKTNHEKVAALEKANNKAAETRALISKLQSDIKNLKQKDAHDSPVLKNGEEIISKCLTDLEAAESNIASAEKEAKAAENYEKLVAKSKQQFQNELQIVLPNYVGGKDRQLTEGDLNLLIAHAHRRIEQLQKQLAKQQVTEKLRVDEAVKNQRKHDEQLIQSKAQYEIKPNVDIESIVASRIATLKENFEVELRQQLHRQAAAHADHLQDALKMKEQELERKHILELEEKLLHQKGVFVSEISGNMARLKGILNFLKAKSEFDKSNKKAQSLFLACQAMYFKILEDTSEVLKPLARDIAAVKCSADEENDYVNSIISSLPPEAVNRGVFSTEALKQQFEKVKQVSRKVSLINENNNSLYSYFLSYVQSLLVIDHAFVPQEELEGKVAIDTSELDTFEILSRISFSLKNNDLEQCLRYTNLLKGKPREIAMDWSKEIVIHLETKQAVKALLAYAAALGVQAYH